MYKLAVICACILPNALNTESVAEIIALVAVDNPVNTASRTLAVVKYNALGFSGISDVSSVTLPLWPLIVFTPPVAPCGPSTPNNMPRSITVVTT